MVIGDQRPHLVALIVPEEDYLKAWARETGKSRNLEIAANEPDFHDAIAEAVSRVNRDLPQAERVRRFLIAPGTLLGRERHDDAIDENPPACHQGTVRSGIGEALSDRRLSARSPSDGLSTMKCAAILLIGILTLAGCYQSRQAVVTLANSAQIEGLSGRIRTGENIVSVFRYDAVGRDYVWETIKHGKVAKSGRLRALAIKDELWLLQFKEAGRRPVYMLVFYRFDPARRQLQVMLPDRKVGELRSLASKFGVVLDENGRLTGRRKDILRFLKSHRSVPFVAAKR